MSNKRPDLRSVASPTDWPDQFTKIVKSLGGHRQEAGQVITTPACWLVFSVSAASLASRKCWVVLGRYAFPDESARAAAELKFKSSHGTFSNMTFDSVTSPASAAVE